MFDVSFLIKTLSPAPLTVTHFTQHITVKSPVVMEGMVTAICDVEVLKTPVWDWYPLSVPV